MFTAYLAEIYGVTSVFNVKYSSFENINCSVNKLYKINQIELH